jgi:hypothetical protein
MFYPRDMFIENESAPGAEEKDPAESVTVDPSRLTELEEIIDREKRRALAIGNALREIQEAKLYRTAGYKDFGNYVHKRWGYHRSYAYRLIKYAKDVADAVANGDTPAESEGSFRAAKRKTEQKQPKPSNLIHVLDAEFTSKLIHDLDAEFESFKVTIERWRNALCQEDYLQLVDKVRRYTNAVIAVENDTEDTTMSVELEDASRGE